MHESPQALPRSQTLQHALGADAGADAGSDLRHRLLIAHASAAPTTTTPTAALAASLPSSSFSAACSWFQARRASRMQSP